MDALTASIIVALIGAISSIVIALITARARIGVLPAIAVRDSSNPSHVPINLPESAKKFRVLGWMLVLMFYLTATFCLLQGLNDLRIGLHWEGLASTGNSGKPISAADFRTELKLPFIPDSG
jgi:hypothetical protein